MKYYFYIDNNKINGKGQCEDDTAVEVSQEVYNDDIDRYIWNGAEIILDPDYEEKQAQKRRAEFHKEFFNTSLGYIRRSVTMADGSHKDFLSDLLPVISMAVSQMQSVTILAYTEPDFTQDVEDWTIYQHAETATVQFIQECFNQLQSDFIGANGEN